MGGYGALLLGSRDRRFCAVGAQSPALWLSPGETAPGAFDDAQDYERNDVFKLRPPHPLWIDLGASDPFHDATRRLCTQSRSARSRQTGRPRRRVVERVHAEVPTLLRRCLRLIPRSSCTSTSRGRCGRTRCARSRSGTTTRCPTTSSRSTGSATSPTSSRSGSSPRMRSSTADDFRQVVTDYAGEAASHGAVYLEAIFSPAERVARGVDWDEIFSGYCDGAEQARELHGVEVRLTPDIYRGANAEQAEQVVRYSAKYRERGIVGVGLGGLEAEFPPEPYEPAFVLAQVAGPRFGAACRRGRRAGLGARRARGSRRRPAQARHPFGRGLRSRRRARRSRDRPRRVPAFEPPHRGGPVARGAPVAATRRRRCPLLHLDGRPRDVRHRPDARLRGRRLARCLPARRVRGRRRRRALRRRRRAPQIADSHDWRDWTTPAKPAPPRP